MLQLPICKLASLAYKSENVKIYRQNIGQLYLPTSQKVLNILLLQETL